MHNAIGEIDKGNAMQFQSSSVCFCVSVCCHVWRQHTLLLFTSFIWVKFFARGEDVRAKDTRRDERHKRCSVARRLSCVQYVEALLLSGQGEKAKHKGPLPFSSSFFLSCTRGVGCCSFSCVRLCLKRNRRRQEYEKGERDEDDFFTRFCHRRHFRLLSQGHHYKLKKNPPMARPSFDSLKRI